MANGAQEQAEKEEASEGESEEEWQSDGEGEEGGHRQREEGVVGRGGTRAWWEEEGRK